ncbi:MAG TPA: YbhB/YbcL family Raf kinase inhibitor-like protein [Candidatus Acidoferrales bacterium]|nr:YbhB/YbcL family Raf kinase inhibitor-like protein [Candidatus Acidoferrales bacterium]
MKPRGQRGGESKMSAFSSIAGLLVAGVLLACAAGGPAQGDNAMAFELKSAAFTSGGDIPKKFTCDGADVSPALSWNEPPEKTASFGLIADDPDAPVGTWVHWVLYDLPAPARALPEGVAKKENLDSGARQGRNDFGRIGYGGPCPPAGAPHRYFFKLYALDTKANLKPGATKADLEKAMKGHILAQTELMGRYKR